MSHMEILAKRNTSSIFFRSMFLIRLVRTQNLVIGQCLLDIKSNQYCSAIRVCMMVSKNEKKLWTGKRKFEEIFKKTYYNIKDS
jgi:hypothetical protein